MIALSAGHLPNSWPSVSGAAPLAVPAERQPTARINAATSPDLFILPASLGFNPFVPSAAPPRTQHQESTEHNLKSDTASPEFRAASFSTEPQNRLSLALHRKQRASIRKTGGRSCAEPSMTQPVPCIAGVAARLRLEQARNTRPMRPRRSAALQRFHPSPMVFSLGGPTSVSAVPPACLAPAQASGVPQLPQLQACPRHSGDISKHRGSPQGLNTPRSCRRIPE